MWEKYTQQNLSQCFQNLLISWFCTSVLQNCESMISVVLSYERLDKKTLHYNSKKSKLQTEQLEHNWAKFHRGSSLDGTIKYLLWK